MSNNFLFLYKTNYMHSFEVDDYYKKIPFDPPEKYIELPFVQKVENDNRIHHLIRRLLIGLEMDNENIGTAKWNPFKGIIEPGNKVLIKPNLVTHYHYLGGQAVLGTVVHGSILRPLLDYVSIALKGKGSVAIADTPIEHAEFETLMNITQIRRMFEKISSNGHGVRWPIIDLRQKITNRQKIEDNKNCDPLGYVEVDLGGESCFSKFDAIRNMHYYTLADRSIDHLDPDLIKTSITDRYHNSKNHRYVISKTVLDSDVIINVAKLKTHCKAGVSLSLKNMIGIVSTKDCMPHHRPGSPPGGDAFPAKPPSYYTGSRKIYRDLRKKVSIHKLPGVTATINLLRKKKIIVGQQIEHGSWIGNDTLWRTILDVNRIAVYADKNGIMRSTPQRKFFCVIDGIIGQEGDAPISGMPKPCGVLIAGFNPVLVDALGCKIMGIDYRIIKTITEAAKLKKWPLLIDGVNLSFPDIETPNLHFEMPRGWR